MIEIDGRKYATTAWERDVKGLPPSPDLERMSKDGAKGGRKSRRGLYRNVEEVESRIEELLSIPEEDRGPFFNDQIEELKKQRLDFHSGMSSVQVKARSDHRKNREKNTLSKDARERTGLFTSLVRKEPTE